MTATHPRTENWSDVAAARVAAVHAHQRLLHMEPRGDSRLTTLFAQGDIGLTAEEVARELMATHFIFSTTLYGEVLPEFMRLVAGRLRDQYGLTWTSTWTIVRAYAPTALKLMMLSSTGSRIPEHLEPPEPPTRWADMC